MALRQIQHRLPGVLKETIISMCKNMVEFQCDLSVEGLIGITVDSSHIFLVSVNEHMSKTVLPPAGGDNADQTVTNEDAPKKKKHDKKDRKKRRRRESFESDDTEPPKKSTCKSDETEKIDVDTTQGSLDISLELPSECGDNDETMYFGNTQKPDGKNKDVKETEEDTNGEILLRNLEEKLTEDPIAVLQKECSQLETTLKIATVWSESPQYQTEADPDSEDSADKNPSTEQAVQEAPPQELADDKSVDSKEDGTRLDTAQDSDKDGEFDGETPGFELLQDLDTDVTLSQSKLTDGAATSGKQTKLDAADTESSEAGLPAAETDKPSTSDRENSADDPEKTIAADPEDPTTKSDTDQQTSETDLDKQTPKADLDKETSKTDIDKQTSETDIDKLATKTAVDKQIKKSDKQVTKSDKQTRRRRSESSDSSSSSSSESLSSSDEGSAKSSKSKKKVVKKKASPSKDSTAGSDIEMVGSPIKEKRVLRDRTPKKNKDDDLIILDDSETPTKAGRKVEKKKEHDISAMIAGVVKNTMTNVKNRGVPKPQLPQNLPQIGGLRSLGTITPMGTGPQTGSQGPQHVCQFCSTRFNTAQLLSRHQKMDKCNFCGGFFSCPTMRFNHELRDHHNMVGGRVTASKPPTRGRGGHGRGGPAMPITPMPGFMNSQPSTSAAGPPGARNYRVVTAKKCVHCGALFSTNDYDRHLHECPAKQKKKKTMCPCGVGFRQATNFNAHIDQCTIAQAMKTRKIKD